MKHLLRFTISTIAAMSFAAALLAQDLPKAETILEHYVEVTGGRAVYEQHQTEIMMGTVAFPEQGLSGRLTRYAAPDKEYSSMEINPIGKIETGVIRGIAWEKSAILGPRIKSGQEKEQAIRESRFNAPIEWRKLYTKVETTGMETINGEECYRIVLTPRDGKPETEYYSKKSGLLLRTTMIAVSQMGEIPVEVNVSDYKQFGGILMPTHSEQKAGEQKLSIHVDRVSVNEPIPADYFEPPADVKALLANAPGK